MLEPTADNGGLAMLQELAQRDLLQPAAIEPYYFKYEITAVAVPILERLLSSPIRSNRHHALIALVRYTTAVGYALDALLLHTHGVFDGTSTDDIVGANILYLLAARGDRDARKIMLALIHDQGWVDTYLDGFLLFKALHLGASTLEELFDAMLTETAATWPLVRGPNNPNSDAV
jgi:hypothetical protein